MKSILELSEVKAYRYFMESSNYCSLDLPKYINFSKVLTYVEEKVGKKSFDEILKDRAGDFVEFLKNTGCYSIVSKERISLEEGAVEPETEETSEEE